VLAPSRFNVEAATALFNGDFYVAGSDADSPGHMLDESTGLDMSIGSSAELWKDGLDPASNGDDAG